MKIYTTHCPKCKVVEKKLTMKGLEFEQIDNPDEVVKFGEEHGINSAPIVVLDDGKILDFSETNKWLATIG